MGTSVGMLSQRCPRCGGNLYIEPPMKWHEIGIEAIISCLMCPYTAYLERQLLPSTVFARHRSGRPRKDQQVIAGDKGVVDADEE